MSQVRDTETVLAALAVMCFRLDLSRSEFIKLPDDMQKQIASACGFCDAELEIAYWEIARFNREHSAQLLATCETKGNA